MMSTMKEYVERLSKLPQDMIIVDMYWCGEDISQQAEQRGITLTEEQVGEIADVLACKHDANMGINWDQIDWCTDYVLGSEG